MPASIHSRITLVDYLYPVGNTLPLGLLREIVLILGFSLFIALCAQVSFLLPYTVVPVTLQTLGILLTGAALGSRRGALAVLAYLAEGASGLPVFAGPGGIARLIGFTAGYLWAFPLAAFITGWLCEKGFDRNLKTSALAMIPGSIVIYAVGVPWLAYTTQMSLALAFTKGAIPFIIGDLLKLFIAAALLPTVWKLIESKIPVSKHKN